jgi:hypothetical protein
LWYKSKKTQSRNTSREANQNDTSVHDLPHIACTFLPVILERAKTKKASGKWEEQENTI